MIGMAASAQASATRATIFGMEIPPSSLANGDLEISRID
jgi:hypothetical protein